jgi:hypothetical protein
MARLFPQISQIFSADLRRFLKYNLQNLRKSAKKICEICGKEYHAFFVPQSTQNFATNLVKIRGKI